jgi:hypothetical protein
VLKRSGNAYGSMAALINIKMAASLNTQHHCMPQNEACMRSSEYLNYHPLVPKEYQDECCPMPCKEVLERENDKKKAKGRLKTDEKKDKKN